MEKSTLKIENSSDGIENTNIFRSKVIKVEDYKDLGTWDEVGKLLAMNN